MLAPCLAQAADLEVFKGEQPTIYVPNYFVWGGIYVGGFLGGGRGTADGGPSSVTVSFTDTISNTALLFVPHANVPVSGFLGGGRVGANYQAGPFVFGFEGDFTGMTLKGHATLAFAGTATAKDPVSGTGNSTIKYTTTSAYKTTADWATTFTGRVGYTFDRLLAYGKAGMAVEQDGDAEVSTTTFTATPGTASSPSTTSRAGTATRYGWTVGAGLEYAFDKHWSGFVEYDHLGFLSQIINFTTVTVPALPAGAGAAVTTRLVALNIDRVVSGVDYRF
jgi:outer membrane immunogenic protein